MLTSTQFSGALSPAQVSLLDLAPGLKPEDWDSALAQLSQGPQRSVQLQCCLHPPTVTPRDRTALGAPHSTQEPVGAPGTGAPRHVSRAPLPATAAPARGAQGLGRSPRRAEEAHAPGTAPGSPCGAPPSRPRRSLDLSSLMRFALHGEQPDGKDKGEGGGPPCNKEEGKGKVGREEGEGTGAHVPVTMSKAPPLQRPAEGHTDASSNTESTQAGRSTAAAVGAPQACRCVPAVLELQHFVDLQGERELVATAQLKGRCCCSSSAESAREVGWEEASPEQQPARFKMLFDMSSVSAVSEGSVPYAQ